MKKILLVVLGLVACSASFANTNDSNKPLANASVINNDKVKLMIAPMKAKARLDLTDNQGHVIYTRNLNLGHGIQQIFDISQLEKGLYQFSVSVGEERTVKSFDVTETTRQQSITFQD